MPKTYEYATLDDVLQALSEEQYVRRADVRPSLHDAYVWQAMESMSGGYMPHARSFSRAKRHAVDGLCESVCHATEADRAPNGMRRDLMDGYAFHHEGTCYEVVRMTVRECLS